MSRFITNIHVNQLFHLGDFDIPIASKKNPHLIITGKNGSGKTILLNAIVEFLNNIKDDQELEFCHFDKYFPKKLPISLVTWSNNPYEIREILESIYPYKLGSQCENAIKKIEKIYGKVAVSFDNVSRIIDEYQKDNFIIAFYEASRIVKMSEPSHPTKPKFLKKANIKETNTIEFLNFLSDLRIQGALARNEKQTKEAEEISTWFSNFEKILGSIFQDDDLSLEFNYKDYSFRICTDDKKFKFTEVSDGFSAILDIVADLIMKMQDEKSLSGSYKKEGIVLIDEIETHLHLGLQKAILPLLTKIFPNIQFIVTTHSPFVLNSIPNAVAYDLEHREILSDLTEYSYESLAEGYFGVKTQSSYAEMQLENLKNLLEKKKWSDSDKVEIKQLISEFDKIPETASPLIKGEYRQLAVKYSNRIKEL